MKASEFKYLQNSTTIFAKSLQKPTIEGERGLVLGLDTLEASLYAQHIEIRSGPTEKWSAIQVDWPRKELSCQHCSGYVSWLSLKNGFWVCDECGEYQITKEQRLINKFRRMANWILRAAYPRINRMLYSGYTIFWLYFNVNVNILSYI